MYIPPSFAETDVGRLHQLMLRESFATLVTVDADTPFATHLPFLLDAERSPFGTLVAHVAHANPQWRAFATGREVLVIFHGPHAYISPQWYRGTAKVPTWNYAAVHAYGRPQILDQPEHVRAVLTQLTQDNERSDTPWRIDHAPDDYIANLQRAIVAFEIPITRLEGKFKLSQNKPVEDQQGAIAGLRTLDNPTAHAVADLMEERRG